MQEGWWWSEESSGRDASTPRSFNLIQVPTLTLTEVDGREDGFDSSTEEFVEASLRRPVPYREATGVKINLGSFSWCGTLAFFYLAHTIIRIL